MMKIVLGIVFLLTLSIAIVPTASAHPECASNENGCVCIRWNVECENRQGQSCFITYGFAADDMDGILCQS